MENKQKNLFDQLDSMEKRLSLKIIESRELIKEDIKNETHKEITANKSYDANISSQQTLKNFIISSKKEYAWFGTIKEFNNSKLISIIVFVAMIAVGLLSSIFTSIAFKMYSTFTLIENIWLIMVCFLLFYTINAKKRMTDVDLKDNSNYVFIKNADEMWVNTNKEKKRFKWLRRLSFVAAICNIIVVWTQSTGAIAITATILELFFAGLTIGVFFAHNNLFCMYSSFILFTGQKGPGNNVPDLIFDGLSQKLISYEKYDERLKQLL